MGLVEMQGEPIQVFSKGEGQSAYFFITLLPYYLPSERY